MRKLSVFLSILTAAVVLFLAACTPQPTPAPTAEPTKLPRCSVLVGTDASSMSGILSALGKNYYSDDDVKIVVNGVVRTKTYSSVQSGDYVVLEEKPASCTGEYSAARRVNFAPATNDPKSTTAWWRDVSGFKGPITPQRIKTAVTETCGDVSWYKYGRHFNNDLSTGGCNYPTFVKMSQADGTVSCTQYASMLEAYNASIAADLKNTGWFIVFSVGETQQDFCK